MAIIWFIFIIFPCHCAVYMYKIMILQKPLSQFPPNFTLILLLKCDCLFKWSCSIDCQAHIFFFKTKNCSNDDIFISCDDRIGKMLHNICMSAVAMSLRWANLGLWAYCLKPRPKIASFAVQNASSEYSGLHQYADCSESSLSAHVQWCSRPSIAQTSMVCLPWLIRTHFWVPIAQENKYLEKFYHNICILCVLIRIASLRQF